MTSLPDNSGESDDGAAPRVITGLVPRRRWGQRRAEPAVPGDESLAAGRRNSFPASPPPPPPSSTGSPAPRAADTASLMSPAGRVLVYFLLAQFGFQIALLVPALQPMRIVWRTAAFGASLVLLALLPGRGRPHPSFKMALAVLGILVLQFAHPSSPNLIASLATVAMNASVIAPLFWASRRDLAPADFRRVILVLWLFQTCSAAVGVLQTWYPDRFELAVSPVVLNSEYGLEMSQYEIANGTQILRPMGLTDQPGGAASAGLFAVIFGLGLMVTERRMWLRAACAASILLGVYVIYMCQVRVVFVTCLICLVAFSATMVLHGRAMQLLFPAAIGAAMILLATLWAFRFGGEVVQERFATLLEADPATVYSTNRGAFLEATFRYLIWEHPLGAGLGRWGMIAYYFAPNDPQGALWAEIQWTGWLYDGGVPMMACYAAAVLYALWVAWMSGRGRQSVELVAWAALIFAYDVATLAVTFSYPIFASQSGLEFWLLNGALFAVVRGVDARAGGRGPTAPAAAPADSYGAARGATR